MPLSSRKTDAEGQRQVSGHHRDPARPLPGSPTRRQHRLSTTGAPQVSSWPISIGYRALRLHGGSIVINPLIVHDEPTYCMVDSRDAIHRADADRRLALMAPA
jgi:hypothetical protein